MASLLDVGLGRTACVWAIIVGSVSALAIAAPAVKPNVIVVITDDQGYGDIAAHGNPVIKTPAMDKLHAECVRLTDYHVDPTCSPTRAALMTGRYSTRVGVWHTINGRSILPGDELTLAEVFKANGYRTAMFGKWHLGDNYPSRPQDQGFEHVVWHQGGGVGQGPDHWGNDYFDDTYEVNGKKQEFTGYCTDVWFAEATKFIDSHKAEPFFVYLSTNAPHGPYHVEDRYAEPYRKAGVPEQTAKFLGMITNIDENLAKLRAKLDELGLSENTLLIYTTDNGTAEGAGVFNAQMKGAKGSQFDGGHRVPMFMHWPAGGIAGGRDSGTLCAHIDVMPTLVDLLGLKKPDGRPIDGVSLRSAILGDGSGIAPRTLFAHTQRQYIPPKWDRSAAMNQRWRLVDGKQLYDISADPGQKNDVAGEHPDVVAKLRADYEAWWKSLEPAFEAVVRIGIGGPEDPVTLMSHDWLLEKGQAPWHQNHVKQGAMGNGPWALDVVEAGEYDIALYRWAPYTDTPMNCTHAAVQIGTEKLARDIEPDATSAVFRVKLDKGPTMLTGTLTEKAKERGAYYATIKRVD